MFFKEVVHFVWVVRFMCIELFIPFPYPFDGGGVSAPVLFLIMVICAFFGFFLCVSITRHLLIDLFKEPAICFIVSIVFLLSISLICTVLFISSSLYLLWVYFFLLFLALWSWSLSDWYLLVKLLILTLRRASCARISLSAPL